MIKFRKKPVVVEAVQWTGANVDEVLAFCFTYAEARRPFRRNDFNQHHLMIDTLEGTMTAEKGDWIVRGVNGEFYPCKPDIFVATYEPVEEINA